MRLYEYEAKRLLARYGVQVPAGTLWPELPGVQGPFVLKAQVLSGKRGKHGGIRFADDRRACEVEAEALLGSQVGDYVVKQVYVEEQVDIDRELYLAVLIDRDRRAPLLVATTRGGMDVEDVPEEDLVQLPINPSLGLRPFTLRYLTARLGLSGETGSLVAAVANGLYAVFEGIEAELVEVNPLAVTRDGQVVALDAKVVLDDGAAFRHPDRPTRSLEGTEFEQACAGLGMVGVEMDGTVAAIVSGAGLMMATVDLLSARGVRLRAAVDLGGTGAYPERRAQLIRLVVGLGPEVIFINAFQQLAFTDVLAQAISDGFSDQDYKGRVVIRLKGRNLPKAKAALESLGFTTVEYLPEAIQLVVAAVEERHTCQS